MIVGILCLQSYNRSNDGTISPSICILRELMHNDDQISMKSIGSKREVEWRGIMRRRDGR